MLKEFREFIARGNVIDLAVAVVIGAAFAKIVTTLVDGVLMPPIGLLTGRVNFTDKFINLSDAEYKSLAEAKAAGAPVIAYGALLNDIVVFFIIGFVVFLLVRAVNRLKSKLATDEGPTTKDCPHCLSTIPLKATRCAECCIDL
ncbi:MAG TPA: large conductance mechanosensitive channel protein MscL [Pyrinomonadaceae bacterium]|jgi:large conductance mechanosensitive channel